MERRRQCTRPDRHRPAGPSCDGLCARRRARQPADGADRPARQARRLFRRQVAHHRLRAVQRAQFRHPPHGGRDAVQGAQPDSPSAARLELLSTGAQRKLRYSAREPARRRRQMVCSAPPTPCIQNIDIIESYDPRYIVVLAGDHVYKMDLRADAAAARRAGRRRHRRLPRSAARGGQRLRRDACRRHRPHPVVSGETGGSAGDAGPPDLALASMGIYVFDTRYLFDQLRRRCRRPDTPVTISARTSSRGSCRRRRRSRIRSNAPACDRTTEAPPYWRDVGTLDSYFAANIDLTDIVPDLDLFDRDWPIWTYARDDRAGEVRARRGRPARLAVSSVISGGSIISGATLRRIAALHRRARAFVRAPSTTP